MHICWKTSHTNCSTDTDLNTASGPALDFSVGTEPIATRNPALGFYSFRDEGRQDYAEEGKSVGEEARGCVSRVQEHSALVVLQSRMCKAWTCQQGSRGLLAFCSTSTANEPAAYKATVPLQPIPTPVLSTALSRPITWTPKSALLWSGDNVIGDEVLKLERQPEWSIQQLYTRFDQSIEKLGNHHLLDSMRISGSCGRNGEGCDGFQEKCGTLAPPSSAVSTMGLTFSLHQHNSEFCMISEHVIDSQLLCSGKSLISNHNKELVARDKISASYKLLDSKLNERNHFGHYPMLQVDMSFYSLLLDLFLASAEKQRDYAVRAAAVPLGRECGNGDSQVSVKSLASIPKLEVVVKVMRMLAIPVVLIYGNYFSLTNEGYPQMIQHEQFMEETEKRKRLRPVSSSYLKPNQPALWELKSLQDVATDPNSLLSEYTKNTNLGIQVRKARKYDPPGTSLARGQPSSQERPTRSLLTYLNFFLIT
ncbi:hypothetical protein Q9966_013732 [Columba livia]|nr:hypothetical protein Q9966_013732 [Columba livia]